MSYDLVTIDMEGVEALAAALERGKKVRLNAVLSKNLTEMHNRAKTSGTPVSTEKTRPGGPHGELRLSAGMTAPDPVSYTHLDVYKRQAGNLNGLVSQETQLSVLSIVENAKQEIDRMEEEQDKTGYMTDYPLNRTREEADDDLLGEAKTTTEQTT